MTANGSAGALLIHHHNAAGVRAEAVPLVKAQELVGRALTVQLMPIRADVTEAQNAEWKTKSAKPLWPP